RRRIHPSPTPGSAGETRSSVKKKPPQFVPPNVRRERHNSKERERRRRIRLCCDELNMLVPFCQADTDKVTTLQWAATYLRYVNKIYGDAIKEVCLLITCKVTYV
uniref:BHLH domain-containing protein n=1 Tax=Neogobius melanostomus TaxID=47308 RepID=A0A8C6SW85_9GOBI